MKKNFFFWGGGAHAPCAPVVPPPLKGDPILKKEGKGSAPPEVVLNPLGMPYSSGYWIPCKTGTNLFLSIL